MFDIDTKFKYLLFGIVTFLIVFIGVVGGFSFNKLINDKDNLPENLKNERNLLVVLLNDDRTESEELFVTNINPKDASVSVVSIPKSIEIDISDEKKPFKRAYTENKSDDVKTSLENKLGIKINNYICADKKFIEGIFGVIEGSDISFENQDNVNLVKSAFEALCNKNLSEQMVNDLLNLVKSVKSDIASYDFEEYSKIFYSMKNINVMSKEINGKYEYKEGEMFFINDKISKDEFFK